MNTIKFALATLVIAASATTAFAAEGTSGRSDRIVTEVRADTASYANSVVAPSFGWASQGKNVGLTKVHTNKN